MNLVNERLISVTSSISELAWELGSDNTRPAGAIFLTSYDDPRIRAHFRRLQEETKGWLDPRYVINRSNFPEPDSSLSCLSPEKIMPLRMQRMRENGGMYGGFLDVLFVPLAMAMKNEFVWIIEYDVDFSGDWGNFFSQFESDRFDLLTTSLITRAQSPEWEHWETAKLPPEVPESQYLRSFNPIMRLSQRFLATYVQETARRDWPGHTEYIIPTLAAFSGHSIADMGGEGEFCLKHCRGRNYINAPEADYLTPGTFIYRPSREVYFSENKADFPQRDMLYRPVKPYPVQY